MGENMFYLLYPEQGRGREREKERERKKKLRAGKKASLALISCLTADFSF
jgi:hypothetical protein